MENLNDVEFGSDKSTEEAPILIAQRYLNIYRQIHIFNKEKRDQFDDELLALPQNVSDFFKKMPGGRLLVEHIEEVKTERGISFVKSNKEDFTNGEETPHSAGAVQPVAAGSVTIDASFAQTLAQSMANAFKQLPTSPISGSNTTAPSSADFSKAFDLIAEEIKMSRTSLLDVLQEMHAVTSSLIASQVSIARTLENILSQSGIVVAEPQNLTPTVSAKTTIQAPMSFSQNEHISKDEFNYQINSPIDITNDTQLVNQQTPSVVSSNEQNHKKKKKKKNKENRNLENLDHTPSQDSVMPQQTTDTVKAPSLAIKSEELVPAFEGIIHSTAAQHIDPEDFSDAEESLSNVFDDMAANEFLAQPDIAEETPVVTAPETISTTTDNFSESTVSEIDLNNLAELINDNNSTASSVNSAYSDDISLSNHDNLADSIDSDGLDFALPEQGIAYDEETIASDISDNLENALNDDGLDYALPEQNLDHIDEEPIVVSEHHTNNLDDILQEDGLDFTLPQNSSALKNNVPTPQDNFDNLDGLLDNDGLNFSLPEQHSINESEDSLQQTPLDNLDFMFGKTSSETQDIEITHDEEDMPSIPSNLDDVLSLSEQETTQSTEEEITQFSTDSLDSLLDAPLTETESHEQPAADTSSPSFDGLDDVLGDSLNVSLDEPSAEVEENINLDENTTSLDALIADNTQSTHLEDNLEASQQEPQQSRYSAELDRIRAALTSDNVDISSLDQPIELDDYDDDEGIPSDEDTDEQSFTSPQEPLPQSTDVQSDESSTEDWDWEYVDENGNPVSASGDDEDWEWEYVEDDEAENEPDNNNK